MTILIGVAFVVGTAALACTVYLVMRGLVHRRAASDTKDLAGSVIFRVSALHGLILALVFAQELLSYQELRSSLVREATAVADIYNDARRYGGAVETDIQAALSRYVRVAAGAEWQSLSESGALLAEGWALHEDVYIAILDLVPETPRQVALRAHMLEDIQLIANFRQLRENMALHAISTLFWAAALVGVVLISMPYFIFQPSPINLMLLSVYGAFTGFVLFIIYALNDPFTQPGQLQPVALEQLLRTEIGNSPVSG